jgi:hypothetical protein
MSRSCEPDGTRCFGGEHRLTCPATCCLAHALDQAKAARLWQVSLGMIAKAHPQSPSLR